MLTSPLFMAWATSAAPTGAPAEYSVLSDNISFKPTSPPLGILPVPLNSRLQLGDRLFKVSHYALLGRKHGKANAGSYASAA